MISVRLEDGTRSPLPLVRPGQYLTLRIHADEQRSVLRNYSMSGPPDAGYYRFTVKREDHGTASGYLHTRLAVGDRLEIAAPRGTFILDQSQAPVLLISAGIGATPVLAMLHALVEDRSEREVWWLHGARSSRDHSFATEARSLVAALANVRSVLVRPSLRVPPPPTMVRFRMLDARTITDFDRNGHYALTAADFARLEPAPERVFVIENEVNFLAFPEAPDAVVVFGGGYGLLRFAEATWMGDAAVHYWGDIDTHGMAILDEFRGVLPHARSLMMDSATLPHHRAYWGQEGDPTSRQLLRLTSDEAGLYDDLHFHRLAGNLRSSRSVSASVGYVKPSPQRRRRGGRPRTRRAPSVMSDFRRCRGAPSFTLR